MLVTFRQRMMLLLVGSLLVACAGIDIDRAAAPEGAVSGTLNHRGIQDEVLIGGALIQSVAIRVGN